MMRYESLLASRYIKAQKRQSVFTCVSIIAAVAVITMIFTLYGVCMNCLKNAFYSSAPYHLVFSELTEEQEAQLRASLLGDAVNPEISYRETAHGTHLILVHEQSEADEYLVILTLWNGYIIETDVFPGEGTNELTDEQIDTAIQFISDFFIFEKAGE